MGGPTNQSGPTSAGALNLPKGPFSSSAMPTLPRQDPSDESSGESRGGSQKFETSPCGEEMLAGGGLLLCLTCMASPSRAGDIPSRP
jgi:hypothetical protein